MEEATQPTDRTMVLLPRTIPASPKCPLRHPKYNLTKVLERHWRACRKLAVDNVQASEPVLAEALPSATQKTAMEEGHVEDDFPPLSINWMSDL